MKEIFIVKPRGIGTKYTQSMLSGYLSGYPGLFNELFATDPQPVIKQKKQTLLTRSTRLGLERDTGI